MANLSNLEKETVILFNQADKTACITTYDSRLKRRLTALADSHPDECRKELESRDGSADYVFPKAWVRINPTHVSAPLTDEQRAVLRARFYQSVLHRPGEQDENIETCGET